MNRSPNIQLSPYQLQYFFRKATSFAIYTLAPDGIVTSWNTGAEQFTGYTADDIVGRHFSILLQHSEDGSNRANEVLRLAAVGRVEEESWRIRKDGSRFWAEYVIDPVYDDNGLLLGFINITRDMTDRLNDQAKLHRAEEQFRLLVQSVTDYAIFMLSPEGIVTNWNAGAERIKGYTADEIVGKHFSEFYTEEEKEQGLPSLALAAAAKTGRFEREGWRVRKDGSKFLANVVIDPIRDADGSLIGFAKITRDITEQRAAEEALVRAKEELFQTQKLDAIGKLTGGIAHDFNNLLNVIVNGLDLLRAGQDHSMQKRTIEAMRRAADRGTALTQQLLAFARQQPFAPQRLQINQIVSTFESVIRRAIHSNVALDIQLQPKLPDILVDAPQIEAALLNLVVNARDAIEDNGHIVVSTALFDGIPPGSTLPSASYVRIAVRDDGQGMSAEVVQRALEPFFTTKPVGKGTGLGLSQAFGLVQQAQGHISIHSALGEGTTVSMYFPALSSEPAQPQNGDASEKVLIVDDQPDVLSIAAQLFRGLGYDVLTANNGREALVKLNDNPDVAILFSDIVMPGMNGVELARDAQDRIPGLKVILASGYVDSTLREHNAYPERYELAQKPYRLSDLIKKLKLVHSA